MGCAQVQAGSEMLNPNFFTGNTQGIILRWWEAGRLTAAGNFQDGGPFGIGGVGNGVNANVTIVPGVVNNRPVARYNSINSVTTTNAFSSGLNFSSFIVLKAPNAVAAASFIGWAGVGGTQQVLVANAAENQSCFDSVNHPTSANFDFDTKFRIVGVICTAGACTFYLDGVSLGLAAPNVNSITPLTNFGAIGAFFSAFDMAEVVFYSTALTANELPRLTEYFRGKYALF